MTFKLKNPSLLVLGLILLTTACSKSDDMQPCDDRAVILSDNSICLFFEHEGLTTEQENKVQNKLTGGIAIINNLIALDHLHIRIVENASLVIPEIGLGGYNTAEDEVLIAIDPDFDELNTSLDQELIPLLAHEMHHAKRRRSVGYGNTLLQAIISEGLADHFSIEATGVSPPLWSVALTGTALQDWTELASDNWNDTPYDHNAWFFGTTTDIPRWAGYAIGYELVKNYLASHPGQLPSELHDEPASSFLP